MKPNEIYRGTKPMATNGSDTAQVLETRALVPSSASTQLEPTNVQDAFWLATQLVKSGLLGKSVQRPEAAFAIILAGRELGLTSMQSLRSIHIIEGKPTLSADLMLALVKRSPECCYFKLVESSATVATYATDRKGEGETRMSFTMDQARLAGVTSKQNWKTYPDAMLRARCIAALARAVYPDLLMGIYDADSEEISAKSAPMHTVKLPTSEPIEAEVVLQEESAPEEPPQTEEEMIASWKKRFAECKTEKELNASRLELTKEFARAGITKENMTHPLKVALTGPYNTRKTELAGK